jgi:hypothetical protein
VDPFSYLSVLISIILGLGITQLLTGLGRLLQARAGTRLYAPADLRANYFAHARPFFALTMLLLLVSVAKDVVLDGALPRPLNPGTHLVLLTLSAAAVATRREGDHRALAPLVAVSFAAYVTVLFARLN